MLGYPPSRHPREANNSPGKHTILPGSTPPRKHTSRNQTPPPQSTPPREAHPLGSTLPQEAHPSTVTAVEGTHPTGMLSSFSQHYNAVADPGFPRWDGFSKTSPPVWEKPIIFQDFCRKLREKTRGTSLAAPLDLQWKRSHLMDTKQPKSLESGTPLIGCISR